MRRQIMVAGDELVPLFPFAVVTGDGSQAQRTGVLEGGWRGEHRWLGGLYEGDRPQPVLSPFRRRQHDQGVVVHGQHRHSGHHVLEPTVGLEPADAPAKRLQPPPPARTACPSPRGAPPSSPRPLPCASCDSPRTATSSNAPRDASAPPPNAALALAPALAAMSARAFSCSNRHCQSGSTNNGADGCDEHASSPSTSDRTLGKTASNIVMRTPVAHVELRYQPFVIRPVTQHRNSIPMISITLRPNAYGSSVLRRAKYRGNPMILWGIILSEF